MTCHEVQPQLNTLVDGELSLWAAWRVRQHVVACPACAPELEEIQKLGARARQWRNVAVPANLSIRIAAALPEKENHMIQAQIALPAHRTIRRAPWNVPWRSLAAAAVIGLVCLGLAFLRLGRPQVAFAQVVSAMQHIKTAQWVTTNISYDPQGREESFPIEYWARLNPPALAFREGFLPGKNVTVEPGLCLEDARGRTFYTPRQNRWTFDPHGENVRDMILYHIFPANMMGGNAGWDTQAIERQGQALTEFHRKSVGPRWTMDDTLWVDADHRLARSESRQYDSRNGRLEAIEINDRYKYNQSLPEALFALKPPAQSHVYRTDAHASGLWKTLSEGKKQKIERVIAQMEQGWQESNFDAFASVWDFGYLGQTLHAPLSAETNRSNWQARLTAQRGRWQKWHSDVTALYANRFVSYPGSKFVPEGEPDLLNVSVNTHIVWTEDGKVHQTDEKSTFYLRPEGDGYKIVHWLYPDDNLLDFRIRQESLRHGGE